MKRRDSIKTMVLGTVGSGLLVASTTSCETEPKAESTASTNETESGGYGRTPKEKERDAKLNAENFFSPTEMAQLAVLCNLILPADEKSGSAVDAEVPDFIEFMVKDIPEYQLPLRGGLMWLNHESSSRFDLSFVDAQEAQQKEILDDIAYPLKEGEEENHPMAYGIEFFNLIRNLTLTGFYTSEMGVLKDLEFKGNIPNIWDGVPEEVLKDHDVDYDPEWLAKCIDQSKRDVKAEWDDAGNLIS